MKTKLRWTRDFILIVLAVVWGLMAMMFSILIILPGMFVLVCYFMMLTHSKAANIEITKDDRQIINDFPKMAKWFGLMKNKGVKKVIYTHIIFSTRKVWNEEKKEYESDGCKMTTRRN